MTVSTISSRDFTRDVGSAKRAAAEGPVFITDRGRPAYALLHIDHYHALAATHRGSLLALMDAIPGGEVAFDVPRIDGELRDVAWD